MKRKHLLYALIPVFVLALLAGGITRASTNDAAKPNPFGKLAEAIATKFNLSTSSVQAVIDETMGGQRPPTDNNQAPKIDPVKKALADGKLTQAQADLIYAKRAEIKTTMDGYKDLSESEREVAVKTYMESIRQWAKDNNIPVKHVLPPGKSQKGHGGERGLNKGSGQTTESNVAAPDEIETVPTDTENATE